MKIYIDYDSTLVNLIDPWIDWANEKYSVNLSPSDVNRWFFFSEVFGKEADDFWRSKKYNHYTDKDILQPYPGAVDFVQKVQSQYGKENVYIISSTRDHHTQAKIEHVEHYFQISGRNFIPIAKDKHTCTSDGVLIDDYALHVMQHVKYNKHPGIVFNYEHRFGWSNPCNYVLDDTLKNYLDIPNEDKFHVLNTYGEVLARLDRIIK